MRLSLHRFVSHLCRNIRHHAQIVSKITALSQSTYFFCFCASAEPAALLDAALDRPSLRTCDALVAAFAEVTFWGETCESELPAADLDAYRYTQVANA